MAVERLAVSFDPELAEEVRAVAEGNVSAWLADAARKKLRLAALRELVDRYEQEHGVITDAELEEVRQEWPPG